MNVPLSQLKKAWAKPENAANSANRYFWGHESCVRVCDFAAGTSLGGRADALAGRSVLLTARDQLTAALALIELDGVAGRIVLCPPDLGADQLRSIMSASSVDAIISDTHSPLTGDVGNIPHLVCGGSIAPAADNPDGDRTTEWILLSSGTSNGSPKLVVHTLATLIAPISGGQGAGPDVVWGTFYDIRRYGGLQIFLRTIMGKGSMIFSGDGELLADHLARLQKHGATHISGTPSHWRRVLMSSGAGVIAPQYIRLSGEIADQSILDTLRSVYDTCTIAHAFASTEAGVVFEVRDGQAGFPADLVGNHDDVEMKIERESLRIRSDRTALRYLGGEQDALIGADGFVDTGDIVERHGERYHFLGRRNGIINVGGMKVHPEEIEAVINSHPRVAMSSVRARKNPILGAVVSADVVLRSEHGTASRAGTNIEEEILTLCRQTLPAHKVPASLRLVPSLHIAEAGKLARHNA